MFFLINVKLLAVRCGAAHAVRSVSDFFPQHSLETEYVALRCGTEFSRKDVVKREKRCITNVALHYLLVEIPL